jgi:predicted MFS family arabinose efflux permease
MAAGRSQAEPEAPWWQAAVGAAGGMFVGMGLGRFSYTALVPALIESGQLSATQAGYVGGANMAAFLVGAVLSVALRRRFGIRRLLRITIWFAVMGLAASALPWGAVWLGAWRAVIGVATGIMMAQGLALATARVSPAHRTAAASIVFSGVGLAILFSAVAVPLLLRLGLAWAWSGIALAGICGALAAHWAWTSAHDDGGAAHAGLAAPPIRSLAWLGLLIASFLFSVGIVPYTLYWVDFIVRGLQQGHDIGGLYWCLAGVFAILGPLFTIPLVKRIGTGLALILSMLVLGVGIALPMVFVATPALVLASAIFGAQPAVSALMAARARDLASPAAMANTMRAMIAVNGVGAAIGGLFVPWLFAEGGYGAVFLLGGAAMMIGALACLPARRIEGED